MSRTQSAQPTMKHCATPSQNPRVNQSAIQRGTMITSEIAIAHSQSRSIQRGIRTADESSTKVTR
jgi:hypothetical protein